MPKKLITVEADVPDNLLPAWAWLGMLGEGRHGVFDATIISIVPTPEPEPGPVTAEMLREAFGCGARSYRSIAERLNNKLPPRREITAEMIEPWLREWWLTSGDGGMAQHLARKIEEELAK